MDFVTSAANLRMHVFSMNMKSHFDVKCEWQQHAVTVVTIVILHLNLGFWIIVQVCSISFLGRNGNTKLVVQAWKANLTQFVYRWDHIFCSSCNLLRGLSLLLSVDLPAVSQRETSCSQRALLSRWRLASCSYGWQHHPCHRHYQCRHRRPYRARVPQDPVWGGGAVSHSEFLVSCPCFLFPMSLPLLVSLTSSPNRGGFIIIVLMVSSYLFMKLFYRFIFELYASWVYVL